MSATASRSSSPATGTSPLTILWVDDERGTVEEWIRFLEDGGDRVSLFPTAEEAVARLEQDPYAPDVVLVDAYLPPPGMTGLDLVCVLRERWPHLRTILVTGKYDRFDQDFAQPADLARLEETAYWFLPKDCRATEFIWVLQHVRREKELEKAFALERLGREALDRILSSIRDEVMVIDLEEGDTKHDVLYANEARCAIHGDLVGEKWYSRLSTSGRRPPLDIHELAAASPHGQAFRHDDVCRRPDGTTYHVSEVAAVFRERERLRAVNVVRDEEARFQLDRLMPELAEAKDEEDAFRRVLETLARMGYGRVRLYRVVQRDRKRFLVPWVALPAENEWFEGRRRGEWSIPEEGDPYLAATRGMEGGTAFHRAWTHGRPDWADRVGLEDEEPWIESLVSRFDAEYVLLTVDNRGGSRPVSQGDRYLVRGVAAALRLTLELLYDRREREFLRDLHVETGRHKHPADALRAVVRLFKRFLEADACAVYMHDRHARTLQRRYGLWGRGRKEHELDFSEVFPLNDPSQRGISGTRFLEDDKPTVLSPVKEHPDLQADWCSTYEERLGCEVRSALFLPLTDGGRGIGMLHAVNRREPTSGALCDFADPQLRTARLALGRITPVIRDLLGWERERRRARRLDSLPEVTRTQKESGDPQQVMEVIAREAGKLLQARACSVFSVAEPEEKYDLCQRGLLPWEHLRRAVFILRATTEEFFLARRERGKVHYYLAGECVTGGLAGSDGVETRNDTPLDADGDHKYVDQGRPRYRHFTGVRLTLRSGEPAGMIRVVDKLDAAGVPYEPGFDQEDEELLQTLARQASLALENAALLASRKRLLSRQATLHSFSNVFQTETEREKVLFLFLAGLTLPEGLGYDRAVLLLTDDEGLFLHGEMALGPTTDKEAREVWEARAGRAESLAAAARAYEERGYDRASSIHEQTRGLRFPLDRETDLMPAAVCLDGRPRTVDVAAVAPTVSPLLRETFDAQAFAVAPLKVRGEVFGAVYVDNRFNARPIRDEDLTLLELFCAKGAVALATHRSLDDAAQAEALLAAETIHGLSNRIFAHRTTVQAALDRLLAPSPDPVAAARLLDQLQGRLRRTKEVFSELLVTFRLGEPETIDVGQFLGELAEEWRGRWPALDIRVDAEPKLTVRTVRARLASVIEELAANAAAAMSGAGALAVRGEEPSEEDRTRLPGGPLALRLVVEDDGPGLPPGEEERVFHAGFTTDPDPAKGQGLALARRTIQQGLGGLIYAEQARPGARFVVLLGNLPSREGND